MGTHISRGDVYRRLGQTERAIQDLDASNELNVKLGETYASHAMTYTLRVKEAEARQDIAKAAELGVKEYQEQLT